MVINNMDLITDSKVVIDFFVFKLVHTISAFLKRKKMTKSLEKFLVDVTWAETCKYHVHKATELRFSSLPTPVP